MNVRFPVVALAALLLSAALPAAPTISGRVTIASSGNGLAGIDLDVFDVATGDSVAIVSGGISGTGGNFTMTLPAAGTYIVRADPGRTDGLVDQYYPGSFLASGAAALAVTDGSALTNINFALPAGVVVSGRVTAVGGAALDDIDMDVYASTGELLTGVPARTAGGGFYDLGALPAGSYFVRANPDPALDQFFVTTYFGGSPNQAGSTPVAVGGGNVANVNIVLPPGGSISGTVTDGAGDPLANLDLDVYDANGARMAANAVTAADGTYDIGGFPAGQYRLRVDPTIPQGYPRTWYPSVYIEPSGTLLTVAVGQRTTGVDFSLPRGGVVAGRIAAAENDAALADIDLDIYDATQARVDFTTKTRADGTYTIGPLPPGQFFLRADPGLTQFRAREYYPDTDSFATAQLVSVAGNGTTAGINFSLAKASYIAGVVTSNGSPVAGVDLDLYDAATGADVLVPGDFTRADGSYDLGSLPLGSYKLRVDPTNTSGFALEYFDGKATRDTGDVIVLGDGVGAPATNFALDAGGIIRGRATDASTGQPLVGFDLDIFRSDTLLRMDNGAVTDAAGDYQFDRLPAGSYIVRLDPVNGATYLTTYHPSAPNAASANAVVLGAGATVANIDVAVLRRPAQAVGWMIR
ncbi:MAG: carboxypeptidase regulatory-like domain-containing protein [Candidatus Sumerlaeia bacterium]|nr:carboxypeptidase regulatory-like domain-containing protein [Candidatus Sumerlaeia bacterium]